MRILAAPHKRAVTVDAGSVTGVRR